MSEYVFAGLTSQSIDVFLGDSSSTTGGGLSGLAYNTGGLKAYYRKGATGTVTLITLATQTVGGTWSSGGFVEVDATNMKGVYRFDLLDTMVSSSGFVTLYFYGATNLIPTALRVDCRPVPADVKTIVNGAIDVATLSTNLNAGLLRQIVFTGVTTGVVTADTYVYRQLYNSALAYTSTTLGTPVYLWSNGTNYIASTVLGTNGSAYFQSSTNQVNGTWTAQGTASGTTTVTAHGHTQLALVQLDQTCLNGNALTDSRLANLDAAVSTRMATFSYTTPPTVAAIRTEIDTNSTKLDAAVSTRMATFSYTTPPTVAAIRTEIDTNSTKLDATISSRMATFSYTTPPTVAAIRTEIDTNSTKLDATISSRTKPADTQAAVTTVTGSVGSIASMTLKKNVAFANFMFMMTDSTNHFPATGKTVTVTRSIDGSSFVAGTLANIAEVAFGMYRVDFAAADLNGGNIVIRATATACDDTLLTLMTTP